MYELIFWFFFYFIWWLFVVYFGEPLGYAMINITEVYFGAFYYLTLVVVFVFWAVFCIVWQFYFKLSVDPDFVDVALIRKAVVSFRPITHNETIEFWWTLLPSIIIFFIALPALILVYALETPFAEPIITVKAVGHQWYWSYEYTDRLDKDVFYQYADKPVKFGSYMLPESELQIGEKRLLEVDKPMVLPVETQIRMVVTATDVLHSWAIPSLGVKMDAVPGRLNQFYLYIPLQGVYYGQCSELCGVNHGFMPICLYAVSPEVFVEWYLDHAK